MRVLFTTFAAKAHLHAQVTLAWALQAAGHEVRIASQPDLAEHIVAAGLTAVKIGEPLLLDQLMQKGMEQLEEGEEMPTFESVGIDFSESRPEILTWDYALGVMTTLVSLTFTRINSERMVDDLVAYAREWRPDLVVWDTLTLAGPIAAKACGAAHTRLLFGLDALGRMREIFLKHREQRPPERREDPIAEWMGWLLDKYGHQFSEELVTGQWTIDPVPPSMQFLLGLPTVPVRYVPYNGPSRVPEWLHTSPERERICVTLGLSKREVLGADKCSVEDLIEAVAGLDVEVVATLDEKQRSTLERVPDNVRLESFVPLNALLPSCSLVIHHGGAGTFGTALVHGLPQIIVPDLSWDIPHRGRALAAQGAAVFLENPKTFTANELLEHILTVRNTPSFRTNAERMRKEVMRTPPPAQIVPVLEQLTTEYREHGPATVGP